MVDVHARELSRGIGHKLGVAEPADMIGIDASEPCGHGLKTRRSSQPATVKRFAVGRIDHRGRAEVGDRHAHVYATTRKLKDRQATAKEPTATVA